MALQTPRSRRAASSRLTPLVVLAAAFVALTSPALAHDWQGAATPDCECLPHFKLDCSPEGLAPVKKAWATLVSRRCNETLASAGGEDGQAAGAHKVSLLKDAASAAGAHAGGHAKEEDEEATPAPMFRCQVDQACYEAYHIVIGHHYGCPLLPADIAAGVHYYQTPSPSNEPGAPDTICAGCFQPRYVKRGAPLCPKLNCHDNEAYLLGNLTLATELGCAKDCSSDACKRAYQFLSVHHDGCVLNDNPLPARVGTDPLRRACARHECAFSNGTYAAGTWKVDCKAPKNAVPFKALKEDPAGEEEEVQEEEAHDHLAVDHSAHNHGAASSAPSNLPAAAKSGAAGGCKTKASALASGAVVVLAALMVLMC